MSKKNLFLFLLVVLCILITIAGYMQWNNKLEKAAASKVTTVVNIEEKQIKDIGTYTPEFIEDRGEIIYSPLGDSLTEGYYATSDESKFTSVLSNLIEEEMGFTVIEDGIGNFGGKVSKGLEVSDMVKSKNPDIVTIEYGTNDSSPKNGVVSIEDFEADLNALIDNLYSNEVKKPLIILVTTWNQWEKAIPFDDIIKKVGEENKIPVVDINNIWKLPNTKGPEGVDTPFGPSDNWHPNDLGMQLMAEKIFEVAAEEIDKIDAE